MYIDYIEVIDTNGTILFKAASGTHKELYMHEDKEYYIVSYTNKQRSYCEYLFMKRNISCVKWERYKDE